MTFCRVTILSPTEKLSLLRTVSLVRDVGESAFKKSGPLTVPSHAPPVALVVIVGARNHAMITHTREDGTRYPHPIDLFRGIYRAEYIKGLLIYPRLIDDNDDDDDDGDDQIAPRLLSLVRNRIKQF